MALKPRQGRHYRYEPPSLRGKGALEFWAENGLIMLIDERYPPEDGRSVDVLTVREWLQNLDGINHSIPRLSDHVAKVSVNAARGSAGGSMAEERESLHRLVENGIRAAREANKQGRPDDPKHLAQMARERRKAMVQGGTRSEGAISASIAPESKKLGPIWKPSWRD